MEKIEKGYEFFKHNNKEAYIITIKKNIPEQEECDFENDFKKYTKKNKLKNRKQSIPDILKDFLYEYPSYVDDIEIHME